MENSKIDLNKEFSKLNKNSSVKELQEYTKKMLKARGFANQTLEDVMLLLTEELGEVAKEVRKIEHKIKMDVAKSNEQNLANEISDVYILLMSLCVIGNIDLFEAFKEKEKINLKREWK